MSPRSPCALDALIGRNIFHARTIKGVSQDTLGKALGISFQQVQKYEKGINRISASRLCECAEYLGLPLLGFFEGFDASDFSARDAA